MISTRRSSAPLPDSLVPELIEIEYYRQLAERCGGRAITEVLAPDDWYLKGGTTV